MMHFPDGIMVRPHPMVWRGIMALSVIYLMVIIFFLFQDYKTTRMIIGMYEPGSIIDKPEKDYATDCRISTPENPYLFFHTVMDEFVVAHILGYWGKMIVLRDWRLVMLVSIGFELVECSLQFMLPNFRECWWDHLIIDIVICNAGGAFLGWLTLRAVGAKEYEFVALSEIGTLPGKAKRLALQLVPRSLDRYQWEIFGSFKRFCQTVGVAVLMLLGDTNSFLTKLLWNLEPTHKLVLFRLMVFGFSSIPGIREYYEFVSGEQPYATRIGPMAWLVILNFSLEWVWTIKMARESGHPYFQVRAPAHVALPWIFSICAFFVWIIAFFTTKAFRKQKSTAAWWWRGLVSALLYLVLFVLFMLCVMATPGVEWYQKEFDAWADESGFWPK